jgi:hypothetical protein
VKKKYANEPWYGKIQGEWTGEILKLDDATLRKAATTPNPNDDQLIWRYDAVGELRKVKPPQLWVVAGEDREAPPATTISRLQDLQREGKPIEIVVFPRTDHGMYEFEEAKDGKRKHTRITDGYFRLVSDWILGEQNPPYGAAQVGAIRVSHRYGDRVLVNVQSDVGSDSLFHGLSPCDVGSTTLRGVCMWLGVCNYATHDKGDRPLLQLSQPACVPSRVQAMMS